MMRTKVLLAVIVSALLIMPLVPADAGEGNGTYTVRADDSQSYGDVEYSAVFDGTSVSDGSLHFVGFRPSAYVTITVEDSSGQQVGRGVEYFDPDTDFYVDIDLPVDSVHPERVYTVYAKGTGTIYQWDLTVGIFSKIVFHENGGHNIITSDASHTYVHVAYVPYSESSYTLPTPTHPVTGTSVIADHAFQGWSTADGDSSRIVASTITPSGDAEYYAIWSGTTTDYDVSYTATYVI